MIAGAILKGLQQIAEQSIIDIAGRAPFSIGRLLGGVFLRRVPEVVPSPNPCES